MKRVLLTDYAWPDLSIERSLIEGAGMTLVAGPSTPASAEEIAALARQHDPHAIMTNWAKVNADAIAACSDLAVVARLGVGLDNIDCEAADRAGAIVTNVPDYCVEEVSDHAIALMLDWARGVSALDREVKDGLWNPAGARLRRVRNLTVGIVGFGRIGRRTAQKLAGFGCRVLANNRSGTIEPGAGAVFASVEALVSVSDVVMLQVPLTPQTRHLVSAGLLKQFKPGALLVNVSRGVVVDSDALRAALDSGQLGAAALDVVEGEPQPPSWMLTHPRVVLTPHVAFSSDASLEELRQRAAEEVVGVLNGQPPRHLCPFIQA